MTETVKIHAGMNDTMKEGRNETITGGMYACISE